MARLTFFPHAHCLVKNTVSLLLVRVFGFWFPKLSCNYVSLVGGRTKANAEELRDKEGCRDDNERVPMMRNTIEVAQYLQKYAYHDYTSSSYHLYR